MCRGLLRTLVAALTFLGSGAILLAADVPPRPKSSAPQPTPPGISAVTDAQGNPAPLGETAVPAQHHAFAPVSGPGGPDIQRGQAWWPYQTALPPYTAVDKSAEAMTEEEIMVNGVATLNVKNAQQALALMPADLVLAAASQLNQNEGFYLVKIAGFTRTQREVDALQAAGAQLGEYMNINTYIAKIPASAVSAVTALPFVSFVGDYHPAYKISPRIGLEAIPSDEAIDAATGKVKPWLFEVTLHKGADLLAVEDALKLQGIFLQPADIVANDEMTVLLVTAAPENIPTLAKIPGVKWIAEKTYARLNASSSSPCVEPLLLQNNGAWTTNTSLAWKLWNAGLKGDASGTAQIVTMMDSGLNTEMEHFSQDTLNVGTLSSSHRKVVAYEWTTFGGGGDQCVLAYSSTDGGHGTWTTQHAVGSISNMSTNPDTTHTPTTYYDTGIAPNAKVYFQDIGTSASTIITPTDLGTSITAAIGKGSYVQNYSWGTNSPTYDTQTNSLDVALFANPNFVVTVAAGNGGAVGTGSIGSPSTSKNCIGVGGVDPSSISALFEDCSWDGNASNCSSTTDLGSGRGPVTTSLRVKPDILTYIANLNSVGGEWEAGERPHAMCQSDAGKTVYWDYVNNSGGYGGTSFAAPDAAGLALLIRDYFLAGFYPTGTATPANALTPSGALVKAVLLASGEAVTSTTAYPTTTITVSPRYSSDVGYGRANLPGVLHLGSSAPFLWVQNNVTLGDGATQTFYYNINSSSLPLRVLMTYYDAAGNTLQKDCDLKVTIGSNVYWGNNFSGSWSTATTTTRDHTNNTEGVFLDAAHGLPSSGTVRVDVIGYNDPGGMPYSLVVTGDVASQAVTQVSMDKGKYTCSDTVKVTVNDAGATSPVSVTMTSKNSGGTTIDTQTVSCTGSGGVFTGTIVTGSGIAVVNGGSLTATYSSVTPATASVVCQMSVTDGGYSIGGGCDNAAAGTDSVTGPLYNGGANEYYNKYMDAGEYSSYTFGFNNTTGVALTDVYVNLSFSGAGASKMTVLNNPVHIGSVPVSGLVGAVFQVYTDPSTVGLTSVNMDFDITSPANGYTTAVRLTQVQLLQANDVIARQSQCTTFNTALTPFYESTVTGKVANPWRWSSGASGENRTDGACGSSVIGAALVGNYTTTSNFAVNADSFLLQNFQPALRGNGASGQPYHYIWKWHSFYHASEASGNTMGAWGAFYNDQWNSSTNPTADQAKGFSNALCCYYHTVFDYGTTSWNWETANTGTPDNPEASPTPPNQLFITFNNVTGLATNSTYFAYGHEHWDLGGTATTHRDIALDNDRLVYDEYYAAAQVAASCGSGQVGQVAFDQYSYGQCPSSTAVLSVTDANATSPLSVTVTSPGTGDSEVVTLTGTAPYFSGTLTMSTQTGRGANNGVLFVLPVETISATYTDTSPAGSSTASANIGCTGGAVVYVANTQVSDNGDNDGIADNNETVVMDITIQNNMATALTNAKVTIFSDTPSTIDCITDNQALYGTVAAGATATNPSSDRFTFHVASSVQCSDANNPPAGKFTVVITGDGIDGSSGLQAFTINLDLDKGSSSYTYTQAFASDPGWTTSATPDDEGCSQNYVNNFHWCAACGNGSGGYGAWIGNSAFGTSGQEYSNAYDSSTLYSPTFVAYGTSVGMYFDVAYRTEATYDGAIVQYKAGTGSWTTLAYATPAQSATTTGNYCSPIATGATAWTGDGVSWTPTTTSSVTTTAGQTVQFRWRLGSDSTGTGTTYGGFGVDNVNITGLQQYLCEPTRNSGLPGCGPACNAPSGLTNNTAADLDLCLDSGVRVTWNQDPSDWGDSGSGTRTYSVLRNGVAIATGIAYGTTTYTDNTGVNNQTYTYSVRYTNGCGSNATTTGVLTLDNVVTCTALDQCHDVGTCNGATGVCSNPVKANGTGCNDGNLCTQTDTCQNGTCTGSNPVVCTALDQCHVAGTCNPSTGVCTNPNASNGTGCNDGNACTQTDTCQNGTCTGSSPVVCTALDQCHDVGVCDTGTGVCSNPVKANGSGCNDGNLCTTGDTCQNGTCTAGTPVTCTADQCHDVGTCNPSTGLCNNPNKPNGTTCNDGSLCTQTDTCQNGTCTGSNPVTCTAQDQCHDVGTCSPSTGLCSNPNKPNGMTCNDGNACTQTDTCQNGTCTGSNPVVCTALDQCHDVGVCDTGAGVCSNPVKANGSSCNDGNLCTTGDTCQSGTCTAGTPVTCTPQDQCHDAGTCNQSTGLCSNPNKPNGTTCSDGNACTQTDTCQNGTCNGSNPVTCTAQDQCHDAGVCDTGTGLCSNPAKPNGTTCSDGNACTQTDTCQNGTCSGANPVTCTAQDQCHDVGTCNPSTGVCSNPVKANGTTCSDGNACTQTDTCQNGTCTGANPVTCTAQDQCHDAGTCNPSTGLCSNPVKPNGTTCSDGSACTQTDTCQNGTCTGANPVACTAQDQCHDAGTCNPSTGLCSNPVKPNGATCSDGNACTQTDTCQNGACTGANLVTCTAQDQCHDAGTCNPLTGACSNPVKPNGTTCSDGNACTQTDTCQNGACTGANPVTCAAQDQCHDAGTCNPSTGLCSNPAKPNGTTCNDGSACTQTDTCQNGTCTGANPVTCTAQDQCHDAGTCNPGTGLCSNPAKPNGTTCSDGNACTQTDTCQNGTCAGANPVTCTAQDQCHDAGTCNPSTGLCSNPVKPNGTTCNDGNACTQTDTCQSGTCTGANPVACTAQDQCHDIGTCNPSNGLCSNPVKPNGTTCDDGNPCTAGDVCAAGVCAGGSPVRPTEVNDSIILGAQPPPGSSVSRITWNDLPGPYNVYRGVRTNTWTYNHTCFVLGAAAPPVDDDVAPNPGEAFYYLVSRKNACGESILGRDWLGTPEPNSSPCQ